MGIAGLGRADWGMHCAELAGKERLFRIVAGCDTLASKRRRFARKHGCPAYRTVEELVADPNVDPSHGWRHRFKTVGIEEQIEMRVLDAIQGHAPRNISEGYGEVTIKAKANAIAKFPKVKI